MKMEDLRKELGIASQGRVSNRNDSVLFHLAFRMDRQNAELFIKQAAKEDISEALWGRRVIIEKLANIRDMKG